MGVRGMKKKEPLAKRLEKKIERLKAEKDMHEARAQRLWVKANNQKDVNEGSALLYLSDLESDMASACFTALDYLESLKRKIEWEEEKE